MKTFVIADLHGRADLLDMALDRIYDYAPEGGTIIFTGDYIDRGRQSDRVISTVKNLTLSVNRWKTIALMGNHEDFMYRACRYGADIDLWVMNGGGATLISYGQKAGDFASPGIVPEDHVEFVGNQLLQHYEDKHRIYVHAGIPPGHTVNGASLFQKIWYRYDDEWDDEPVEGKHVVHGHEQYDDGPKLWNYRTDLDTFAWYTGRLVVGVFDDDKAGGPVDLIEIQGKPHREVMADYRARAAGYG